ncbi:MAG: hypothetical protein SOU51_05005 [Collinsella sp.]|nr:hypothetical protein [Collinsella sp.]
MKLVLVDKRVLLAIAGAVWCAAGFNIARIGAIAYLEQSHAIVPALALGSVAVLAVFWIKVFSTMLGKHVARIEGYADALQPFWRFFDVPALLIMAFMMTLGISLRAFSLVPGWFIASFYTGLGVALCCAGIGFLRAFATYPSAAAE